MSKSKYLIPIIPVIIVAIIAIYASGIIKREPDRYISDRFVQAAYKGDLETMKSLLSKYNNQSLFLARIEVTDDITNINDATWGRKPELTAMGCAILKSDIQEIKYLLYKGCNPNLDIDLAAGKYDILEILLNHGADPNICIYYTIKIDNQTTTKLLLDYKANPNKQNDYGQTPLRYVQEFHPYDSSMIALLMQYGANPNIPDNKGVTVQQLWNLDYQQSHPQPETATQPGQDGVPYVPVPLEPIH